MNLCSEQLFDDLDVDTTAWGRNLKPGFPLKCPTEEYTSIKVDVGSRSRFKDSPLSSSRERLGHSDSPWKTKAWKANKYFI